MPNDVVGAETDKDFGKGDAGDYRRWWQEIEAYKKTYRKWLERVPKIIDRFRDERDQVDQGQYVDVKTIDRRYNVLWSNIRTIQPAIYSRTPKPEVSRRFLDPDPVARAAADILQRCLAYSAEQFDFDTVMDSSVLDYLLAARGQAWVRYVPTFGEETRSRLPVVVDDAAGTAQDEEGNPVDLGALRIGDDSLPYIEGDPYRPVVHEEVRDDYVNWQDFGHTIAPTWEKVRAVWKRELMTRAQLVSRFGKEIGNEVSLTFRPKGFEQSEEAREEAANEVFLRAEVYEIWDKESRQALWVSPGLKDKVLDRQDDPLRLDHFFPCPRPLYDTITTDSLVPVPEYTEYQSQADELDELTRRIYLLLRAIKVFGIYDSSMGQQGEFSDMFNQGLENKLVPVDNWAMLAEKGGAAGVISYFPLDTVIQTVQALTQMRDVVKRDLDQITGIADIVRGTTSASETLGVQQLKAGYASLRLDKRKAEVARFARDLFRLKGEVMAEHFSPQTLYQMSGFGGWPEMANNPEAPMIFDAAVKLLREERQRGFRIDIEADSTVLPDQEREQASTVQFLQAVTPFFEKVMIGIQQMPAAAPLFEQILLFGVRAFKVGRHMESSFEAATQALVQQAQQMQASPQEQGDPVAAAKLQLEASDQAHRQEMDKARLITEQANTQARLQRDDKRMEGDQARGMQALAIQQGQLMATVADMQQRHQQSAEQMQLNLAKFQRDTAAQNEKARKDMLDAFASVLDSLKATKEEAA